MAPGQAKLPLQPVSPARHFGHSLVFRQQDWPRKGSYARRWMRGQYAPLYPRRPGAEPRPSAANADRRPWATTSRKPWSNVRAAKGAREVSAPREQPFRRLIEREDLQPGASQAGQRADEEFRGNVEQGIGRERLFAGRRTR